MLCFSPDNREFIQGNATTNVVIRRLTKRKRMLAYFHFGMVRSEIAKFCSRIKFLSYLSLQ